MRDSRHFLSFSFFFPRLCLSCGPFGLIEFFAKNAASLSSHPQYIFLDPFFFSKQATPEFVTDYQMLFFLILPFFLNYSWLGGEVIGHIFFLGATHSHNRQVPLPLSFFFFFQTRPKIFLLLNARCRGIDRLFLLTLFPLRLFFFFLSPFFLSPPETQASSIIENTSSPVNNYFAQLPQNFPIVFSFSLICRAVSFPSPSFFFFLEVCITNTSFLPSRLEERSIPFFSSLWILVKSIFAHFPPAAAIVFSFFVAKKKKKKKSQFFSFSPQQWARVSLSPPAPHRGLLFLFRS